jgi:hypothetical protein
LRKLEITMRKYLIFISLMAMVLTACGDIFGTSSRNDSSGINSQAYENSSSSSSRSANGYEIGDIGPGGGIIFYAQGGQYKECSAELGRYAWSSAITIASGYRGGAFTNWGLPDSGELGLMYENLHLKGMGGFVNEYYWSSTYAGNYSQYNSNPSYYARGFSSGDIRRTLNTDMVRVRAVRSFTDADIQSSSSSSSAPGTTLEIKNQSFTEITDVIWNNVKFNNNEIEKSIKSGTSETRAVQAGQGYIFFKRKTNPIVARTSALVTIEASQQTVFTFTDNTLIVEVNNPNNTGTLIAAQNTVLWFDDAEGAYLPYSQRSNTTYSNASGDAQSWQYGIWLAYNYSLNLDAELSFSLALERKAKLSFWHKAGTYLSGSTTHLPDAQLSINSAVEKTWATPNEWSFYEGALVAGSAAIQFKCMEASLFLDDLLIYYTE